MLKFLNKDKTSYKRFAMTLAEVLLVFSIIGVIASMTIYTAKPFDKNMKYAYAKAYDTLNVAFYNARTTLPKYLQPGEDGTANPLMNNGDFPQKTETFCKMLLEYINFKAEDTKGPHGPSVGGSIPIDQPDNNFSVANCAAKPINISQSAEKLDVTLKNTRPHFVASNGMKFWIGDINKLGNLSDSYHVFYTKSSNSSNEQIGMKYFVVLVDLNGDSRPNTVEITDKKAGDIVAFAVTDQNEVLPLGRPEYDRRYLSARVVYNVNIDQTAEASTSNTLTYYEAKRMAWAETAGDPKLYTLANNPMSVNVYTAGNGIKPPSPFYQDYSQPPYKEMNSITYDKDWCSKKDLEGNLVLNPNACYVKITDYF